MSVTTRHYFSEHDFHAWAERQASPLRRGERADAGLTYSGIPICQ